MSIQRKLKEHERMAYASIARLEEKLDAEHDLRLEAERDLETAKNLGCALVSTAESLRDKLTESERQVGELRLQCGGMQIDIDELKASLDTAMGLLAKAEEWFVDASEWDAVNAIRASLNTTSTEGKDHD